MPMAECATMRSGLLDITRITEKTSNYQNS